MPHWINVTGRDLGQIFQCSECKGKCNCISNGTAQKYRKRNVCTYKYCPRCGIEMDLDKPTRLIQVEQEIRGT